MTADLQQELESLTFTRNQQLRTDSHPNAFGVIIAAQKLSRRPVAISQNACVDKVL